MPLTTFHWGHPGATRVQLAGSFNNWKPVDMFKTDQTSFELQVDVSAGRHEFKFVVDDQWVHDQDQPHGQNEMGSFNNHVDVSAETKLIEVERKFTVKPNCQEMLQRHGFTQVSKEFMVDEYYDTPTYDLMSKDLWLRFRNETWELKFPSKSASTSQAKGGATTYQETSDETEVLQVLKANIGFVDACLDEAVQSKALTSFAKLETHRSTFHRPDGVAVVLDLTDWGFRVGEVEVLVQRQDQVPQACQKISNLAKTLGKQSLTSLMIFCFFLFFAFDRVCTL